MTPEIITQLIQALTELSRPSGPAIVPDAIYTRQELECRLGIGDGTTTLWMDNGLKPCRPGTRGDFFLGSEVIAFMAANRTMKRPTNRKAKLEQRAKGRNNQ